LVFHAVVLITLGIPFKIHMAILTWLVLWGVRDMLVSRLGDWIVRPPISIALPSKGILRKLGLALYPFDVLGMIEPEPNHDGQAKAIA
jgi:hypothetical protein